MRFWRFAALAALCAVGVGVLAWLNRPRDEPAKATVGEAVNAFRDGSGRGEDRVGPGPPQGVYRYATRGAESAKSPLVGATHDYYGVSTITISRGGCGSRERWQVLAGRWTELETCRADGGYELKAVREFHEFFGVGRKDSFRCDSAPTKPRAALRPGASFSSSCHSDDSSVSSSLRVLGFGKVSLGGRTFDAVHTLSRSRLEGGSSGSASREDWHRRSDGLLLRSSVHSSGDSADGGGTHYTEHYTLRLLNPTPLQ